MWDLITSNHIMIWPDLHCTNEVLHMVSARKHCETARHKRHSHINVFLTMRYGQGGGMGLMAPSCNSKTTCAKGHRKKISPSHLDWPSTWIVHLRIYPSFSTLTTILPMFIATGKSMVDLNIIDPENAIISERVSYHNCVPLNRNAEYSGLCHFNQRNLLRSAGKELNIQSYKA